MRAGRLRVTVAIQEPFLSGEVSIVRCDTGLEALYGCIKDQCLMRSRSAHFCLLQMVGGAAMQPVEGDIRCNREIFDPDCDMASTTEGG